MLQTTPKTQLSADPFLTVVELAELTRTSPKTVYDWRLRGVGPVATRVGRSVLFRASAVEAWLAAHEEAA